MPRRKIKRGRRAEGVADRVQPGLQRSLAYLQVSRQRGQGALASGSRGRDRRVAFAPSVTGIIDEEESIFRFGVGVGQQQPIEGQRAVAAKRDPDSIRQKGTVFRSQVESRLGALAGLKM